VIVFLIIGVLLVAGGAFLMLSSTPRARPHGKPRDLRASESVAVWTSSSDQDDGGRHDP